MSAIASLLYSPSYLPGVLVLGAQLEHLTKVEKVLLLDKSKFTRHQLDLVSSLWTLKDTTLLRLTLDHQLTNYLKRPELAQTYTKVHLWSLPYDKVLYLDADTLPRAPLDALLEVDFDADQILAAPDTGFPDVFNSGVFVLKPNQFTFNQLESLATSPGDHSFDGADQGLLNQYFNADPDWVSQLGSGHVKDRHRVRTSKWIPIPFLYNTTPNSAYQYLPAYNYFEGEVPSAGHESRSSSETRDQLETLNATNEAVLGYYAAADSHYNSQVKIIHYIGPHKPWVTGEVPEWWNVWRSRFGEKSIEEVVYGDSEDVAEEDIIEDLTDLHLDSGAYLCDPANYAHIDTPSSNGWDAATEPPPTSSKTEAFGFDPVTNTWDDAEALAATESPDSHNVAGDPAFDDSKKANEVPTPYYGYHRDQAPERVFADKEYVPTHILTSPIPAPSPGPPKEAPVVKANSPDQKFNELRRTSVESVLAAPRIFPWEFRDHRAPERVFD